MTDKQTRPHTVSTRLSDVEYAAFMKYVESNPDWESDKSQVLRRIIREKVLTAAAPPAAPKRKDAK